MVKSEREKYSRLGSADDSTDRTAFGNATAANSNRTVAGDRTDGGRPSDTTAGRMAISRFSALGGDQPSGTGRDAVVSGTTARLYTFGRVRSGQCAVTTGRAFAVGAPGRRAAYA